MSFKIFATNLFEKEAKKLSKKYPSLAADLNVLYRELQANPKTGSSLGKNLYKIRISIKSKGKGKSGGGKVITYLLEKSSDQLTLYLLSIYDKSDVSSLTDKEIAELIKQVKKE